MVSWCLEVRSELSVRNQWVVAGHRDRLVRRKAGHNISLALSHGTVLSPRREGACRTECSASCCVVLSVCQSPQLSHSANSSCSQRWKTCIRTGLVIVLLHCRAAAAAVGLCQQHSCLIPSRGFLRAQCGKERVNLDLRSLSRDNSNGLSLSHSFHQRGPGRLPSATA